jgi:superfamily II DNA or RNA helicase
MSGKFQAVISKIRELDAADYSENGTLFKHFIFTDIRESAFGAKALAGFMIAAGFDFRMGKFSKMIKRKGRLVSTKNGEAQLIHKDPVPGGCDGFAVLQSLPLWKTPLMVHVKKDILNTFNARPDNVNGELLRIIILDSKFKEGIDLKDVKYVHLLEPPIALSDLKQAVGRATRFCGQSGLHFIPRRGWPLRVFTYHTELPGRPPFLDIENPEQKVDAHALMLKHSGLDLAMINLTKELTVLAINSAVDYDLNYKINNFSVESDLLDAVDIDDEIYVAEVESQEGGARRKKLVGLYSVKDLTPQFLSKCFKRANKLFPFSKKQLRATALSLGYKIPNIYPRELYCKLLARDPEYLELIQTAPVDRIRAPRGPRGPRAPTPESAESEIYFEEPTSTPSSAISSPEIKSVLSSIKSSPEAVLKTKEFRAALKALKNLPFAEFQTAVSKLYESFKWESPIVKNGCGAVAAIQSGEAVSFTRTQDFVRHYLTPSSPFKGLLAWHSVGTGKTCMAVAAASTEFEAAGYTILWVTRNALMSDVYKNIFGAVCSIPIIEMIDSGVEIPSDIGKAKRLLSRAWLPPITYRMFQNALQGKNELGRMLAAKNRRDPLHKTFLIMDEVHKLMDGDLSAAEAADFNIIQNFIHKSYVTSKENSVRPLLMTATPITDTPRELFTILNTLIGEPSQRLMDFEDYRKKYTTDTGEITEEGKTYFQDRAKGLISYLNREYDPTTFAQPHFETVAVPAGGLTPPALGDLVARCAAELELPAEPDYDDCDGLDLELEGEIYFLEQDGGLKPKALEKAINKLKKTFKKRRSECEKRNKATRKAHARAVKEALSTAGACWSAQKKLYSSSKGVSQIAEIEECFGKKKKVEAFPKKPAFLHALQEFVKGGDTTAESVSSNTGAVFSPNQSKVSDALN